MTNGERADRLFSEAFGVAEEMRRSLQRESWNLAFRRAQEVVKLVVKGLLSGRRIWPSYAARPFIRKSS